MARSRRLWLQLIGLFFVTNFACGPAAVYVQPAPQLTFDQIIHDEVTFGARRAAIRPGGPRSWRSPQVMLRQTD